MRTLRVILLLLAVAIVASPAEAQTNAGKDFWLAETTNSLVGGSSFAIAIANPSGSPANIVIEHFGSADVNATIGIGALSTFTFTRRGVCATGNLGKNMVYHVTSDQDVVVYIFNPIATVFTNDASLILPVPGLGRNHRMGSYVNPIGNTRGSFLGVVAADDGTGIDVYNRLGVLVASTTIDQGEYYQFVNGTCGGSNDAVATDVTGFRVVTTKPAAVFSGSNCTSLGNSTAACDHIEEQVIPEEAMASNYVACPTRTRPVGCAGVGCAEDHFRYVATEPNTTVTTSPNVGGGVLVNAGDFVQLTTDLPHVVAADKPIYGYQYLVSQDSGSPPAGTGDPSMLDMPPVDQFQFSYIFLTPTTYAFDFINVVAPVGTTFTMDGAPIAPACPVVGSVGGIDYCCFGRAVADGVHTISASQRFGLSVTGFDSFASYAYIGGVGLQPINAGCDTGGPYQTESCDLPFQLPLDGDFSCSDGSTPTVAWSSDPQVTLDDPAALDPAATVAAYGTFQICAVVSCPGGTPTQCCSTITLSQQTVGCNEPPVITCLDPTVGTDPAVCQADVSCGAIASCSDPDFDPVTTGCIPGSPYALGSTSVQVTCSDGDLSVEADCPVTVTDQEPPSCQAPPPIVVECDGSGGVAATHPQIAAFLAAASAQDNCGVSSLTNDAPAFFPSGCTPGTTTPVQWTARDAAGQEGFCTSSVTVRDTTAPALIVPPALVLECSSPGGVQATDASVVAWLAQAQAQDTCGSVDLSHDAPGLFPAGCGAGTTTTVTFSAEDNCGNATQASTSVTVRDTQGPIFDQQPRIGPNGCAFLWPPQHGYVDFHLSATQAAAHDVCHPITLNYSSCASSQPENTTGDGNSTRDCVFTETLLSMRAERRGDCANVDRRYSSTVDAVDSCGNTTRSDAFGVCVYHDMGHQPPLTGPVFSANPGSNQNDFRPGTNGTYGAGCGPGCGMMCNPSQTPGSAVRGASNATQGVALGER